MAEIGETELDGRALARALWRRAWLLVLLAVIAAVGTYVGLGYVDPLYTADTRILIEERESPLTRSRNDISEARSDFDESAIQSQVEVLRSRQIAGAVIDELDLTHRPEFDPPRQPSLLRSLLVMLGMEEDPIDSSVRQRVMESYFERLSVYPLLRSRVIGVEFSAPDPELAAEVANAVASAFVELQQDAKRQSAVAATAWLEQEIARLRERVAESEQAVAEYRATHDLFDVDQRGTESGTLSSQQLSDINAELARARAARAEAEARAEAVQSLLEQGESLDASEDVLDSPLIQRLRERQGALRAQIAELSTTLLPSHPRIRSIQMQVANLEDQIRDEARKVLASLQTAARVAAARQESLLASLNEAKVDVSRSNEEGIELRALEREATAQRELLESFLSRYREASARTEAGYLPADARIISRAVPPTDPSFPKRTMMSVAAAIAVLLIGSAIILLAEFTSGRAFRVIGYGMPASQPSRTSIDAIVVRPADSPATSSVAKPEPPATAAEPAHAEKESAAAAPPEEKGALSADAGVREAEAEETPQTDAAPVASAGADTLEQPAEIETEPEAEEEVSDEEPTAAITPEEAPTEEPLTEEAPAGESPAKEIPSAARAASAGVAGAVAAGAEDEHAVDERAEHDKPGTAGLADILASSSVRVALFTGAEGGEGAGEIAFTTASIAAEQKLRCVLVDVGRRPSDAIGLERPGLGDLLSGDAAFGEVIQRDDDAHIHLIPLGVLPEDPPLQRMQLVIGALTHTYDKVIVVADRLDDWPDEFVRPDIAAIVCAPDTTEFLRTEVYDTALARGARSAIIVRLSGLSESEAA